MRGKWTITSILVFALTLFGCAGEPTEATDAALAGPDAEDVPSIDAAPGAPDAAEVDPPDAAPPEPTRAPIMIAAANYAAYRDQLLEHRPFMVYAWATNPALSNPNRYALELAILESIDDEDVEEYVMFSSYQTLDQKLSQPGHPDELRDIGVTGIGFNSEGGMTPSEEMNSLSSTNPQTNAVARFAAIAGEDDFPTIWGPIRVTADNVPDGALEAMFGAGLAGVGLQEQRFIESACVPNRVTAVEQTANRYRQIAANHGIDAHVNVQIMPSRCLTGDNYAQSQCSSTINDRFDHCAEFVAEIEDEVTSYAIWASGPSDRGDLVELIAKMRAATN
jgi:hypothetical protein